MKTLERSHVIDEGRLFSEIDAAGQSPAEKALDIIDKARELRGLTTAEVAVLLKTDTPEVRETLYAAAIKVKAAIYGQRMVLFAPLYVTNECCNDCLYCAFRSSNKELIRKRLTMEEIAEEVRLLERMGHKRLLLVYGEGADDSIEYMLKTIETVYATRTGMGEIRRVNVNCAPRTAGDFRLLHEAGIGTFQIFQETYHRETYARMHPSGPKSDYDWRITAPDRAFEGGVDDLGIGPLFGLFDWRFEVMATVAHAQYLEDKLGVGPHTISMPRLEPALNAPVAEHPPHMVSDDDFRRIVCIFRLAVPYTGMILSTRESAEFRDELFRLGISQISAGSKTSPGAYKDATREHIMEQFTLGDHRTPDEIIHELCQAGHMPSFCTACYRQGRTGHDFMGLAKIGFIQDFCTPNAILTFKEYLLDYASPATRALGEKVLSEHVSRVLNTKVRRHLEKSLQEMEEGGRDIYM
ncbi:MAG: [FeFe] hydrogenase H-cluster radical SAM maturase HydG [Armatimonadetes bacterium]|nr:[FeFe] hydrogenase H-cluster radical SAM maturase HydG [Armatimonadota bacterium]